MHTITTTLRPPRSFTADSGAAGPGRVLSLGDERCTEHRLAGGKGASLAALSQKGFAVPPGFVVTADAYDAFLRGAVGPVPVGDGERSAEAGVRMRRALAGAPLPRGLRAEVARAMADIPGGGAFAVRSSSTLEDLAEAAFAGMHETRLNCRGVEEVLEAVRACFLSLWNEPAMVYREHHRFAHHEARMAVVVQAMIDCDVAGVSFSFHPVSGDPGTIVVNANAGLGESVVNGEHAVDHFELDRATGVATKSVIGTKRTAVRCAGEGGGVVQEPVPEDRSGEPCLEARQLARVAGLQVAVDEACGFPQDIEWGIAGGALALLQSRPVTRIPERWTRDESAERFPNVITPLTWDMVESGFHRSLRFSMKLMGFPPYHGKWFASHGHYIYGNQNAVDIYLGRAPFEVRDLDQLREAIPRLRRKYRWVQDLPGEWSRDLDAYLLEVGRLSAAPVEDWGIEELWDHVQDLLRLGTEYFLPNIAISITQAKLHQVLFSLLKLVAGEDEAPALFDSLTAFCETRTWEINRELFEMAGMVREDPRLEAVVDGHSSGAILDGDLLGEFPEFARRFERFLQAHGHRELEFDAYCPTWLEVPWIVLDNVRLVLRSLAESESPVGKERELRLRMHAAEASLLERVPDDLRFFFRELLRLARTYTSLDDREHYQTTRLTPPLRRTLRALGNRLVQRGILEDPMDVFFSHLEDLDGAVKDDSRSAWREWAVAVRANKAAYLADRERVPQPVHGEEAAPRCDAGPDGLGGIPGSPGCVEGAVYHVRSEDDFAAFPQGAVLVARATNPSWTPLFYSAAAVVTESGGPLSHGAVIARELHIPAVMAVHGALAALPAGRRVRVDGGRGRISILD